MVSVIKYYNESWENSHKYIKENSVDLFFCDPPYFISGNKTNRVMFDSGFRNDWDRQWKNKEEYYAWVSSWMEVMYKQMKDNASAYICISWEHSGEFKNLLSKVGFKIQNRITWKRDKGRGSKKNWKSMHEDIWFVTKTNNYNFNADAVKIEKTVIAPYRDKDGNPKDWFMKDGKPIRYTYQGNIWTDIVVPFWSMKEVRSYAMTKKSKDNNLPKHSTQKPKDLVKRCILASSNSGDLVVDFFAGSGTTLISCVELERDCIVFDISKLCINMLEKRIENELINYEYNIGT